MVSKKICSDILKPHYTPEEIEEIRVFLTQLSEIVYETNHQKDE